MSACGCQIVGRGTATEFTHNEIVFCPLHAHAEELLSEVRSYLNDCKYGFKFVSTAERLGNLIAKAEGK